MNPVLEKKLKINLKKNLRKTFDKTIDNPVLKAAECWSTLSEQLRIVLGDQIHEQWFHSVKPLVLKNNILLLQTDSNFASQWINTHYQQLSNALILTQDKKLSCFFIAPAYSRK